MKHLLENTKVLAQAGLIAVAALLGMARPGAAAVEIITCPAPQVRGEIVNGLPAGWWTTPVVSHLNSVRIGHSGGTTYLICDYGPSGFVQREAPAGATCTVAGNRFRCVTPVVLPTPIPIPVPVPTPVPTPPGPMAGTITLRTGHGADLDANSPGASTSDLTLSGATNMVPLNGAGRSASFPTVPSHAQCASVGYTSNAFNATPGTHWCIRTSEGRYARISVTNYVSGRVDQLTFDYRVWP